LCEKESQKGDWQTRLWLEKPGIPLQDTEEIGKIL
jgi:hypothetical protein